MREEQVHVEIKRKVILEIEESSWLKFQLGRRKVIIKKKHKKFYVRT